MQYFSTLILHKRSRDAFCSNEICHIIIHLNLRPNISRDNELTRIKLYNPFWNLYPVWCQGWWWYKTYTYISRRTLEWQKPIYKNRFTIKHWGRDKMAARWQTMFSNASSWIKMFVFWFKFHWSLFLRVQLGNRSLPELMMTQFIGA